ncbi:hypothetical protein HDU93_009640 [Gonapodya sp. JEL0774]|nr:hypothetical protein HDU93_009640 [Gonapodya sp. JEL0774]
MCLPNRLGGSDAFAEYGCMLEIRGVEALEDPAEEMVEGGLPRYLVNSVGKYRFRVLQRGSIDGYHVGAIERMEDVDEDDEIESAPVASDPPSVLSANSPIRPPGSPHPFIPPALLSLSSANALDGFDADCKAIRSVVDAFMSRIPIHERRQFEAIHGSVPDEPAEFSFWVANVLPVTDEWKYELLKVGLRCCAGSHDIPADYHIIDNLRT